MTVHDATPPPNPLDASDPAGFVQLLNELRLWAGSPSYRELEGLGGKKRLPKGREGPALPVSTARTMLKGKRLPRMELAQAFVRACCDFVNLSDSAVEVELGRWLEAWRRLTKPEPGVSGPETQFEGEDSTTSEATPRLVGHNEDGRSPGSSQTAGDVRDSRWPPPRQLPPPTSDFVGRSHELGVLTAQLDAAAESADTLMITSLGGTPGVGKTALALWWGHQVADRFPDGHLYVDLHGYGPGAPRHPAYALGLFLEALGVPASQVPIDEESRVGLYRSLVAGKKMLVMLDNAITAEQVRPLLPGSPGCVVLVTSRSELPALIVRNGARPVLLDLLAQHEAVELIGRIVGPARIDREPGAAAAIARCCAYLPLALRVAAQRALLQPDRPLAEIAAELAAAGRRLALLATPDNDPHTDVQAVFSWSYRALPAAEARLFLLLGLHPGLEISVPAAAALADIDASAAQQQLEVLAAVHLLERTTRGRYQFHDLLREYAAERATTDVAEDQRAASVRRVLEWYLRTAFAGYHVLMAQLRPVPMDPPTWDCPTLVFATPCEALVWYEVERTNLVAAVDQAKQSCDHTSAWKLAAAVSGYFQIRKPWDDWIATCEIALSSARHAEDKHGQCWSLSSLGIAYWGLGKYDKAQDCHQAALKLCREIEDRWGEGILMSFLGDVYRSRGQLDDAIRCYRRSRRICSAIDEPWGRWGAGFALHNLGNAYRDLERPEDAITCYEKTLKLSDEIGNDPWGKAQTLRHLADTCAAVGRLQDAITRYQQDLDIRRTIGDRHGEATTLYALGNAQLNHGALEKARESWLCALTIFDELGDPQAHEVRTRLEAVIE